MALTKKFLKTKPVCKVTFKLTKDAAQDAEALYLVGDFNGWDKDAASMKKAKSGDFSTTLDLEVGRAYQFKYFAMVNGQELWLNDDAPDRLEHSEFSGDANSVVDVHRV